jgi:hypothetical protein
MNVESKIEDLQAVSSQVLVDTARIQSLEEEKRSVAPGSRRFLELSDEIERISAEVRMTSHAESDLARELKGEEELPTIAQADEGTAPTS